MTTTTKHAPKWATSRDAVPEGHVQITVYDEETGKRIATVFDKEAVGPIASARELLEALQRLSTTTSEAVALLTNGLSITSTVWANIVNADHAARAIITKATEGI